MGGLPCLALNFVWMEFFTPTALVLDLCFPDDILPFRSQCQPTEGIVSHSTSSALDRKRRPQKGHVTFEEDESSVRSFIGCVYAGGQALPELFNLHGVALLYPIIAQTPEPAILGGRGGE